MTVPWIHLISKVSELIRRDLVLSLRVAQVLYRLPGLVQGVEGVEALDVALLLSGSCGLLLPGGRGRRRAAAGGEATFTLRWSR